MRLRCPTLHLSLKNAGHKAAAVLSAIQCTIFLVISPRSSKALSKWVKLACLGVVLPCQILARGKRTIGPPTAVDWALKMMTDSRWQITRMAATFVIVFQLLPHSRLLPTEPCPRAGRMLLPLIKHSTLQPVEQYYQYYSTVAFIHGSSSRNGLVKFRVTIDDNWHLSIPDNEIGRWRLVDCLGVTWMPCLVFDFCKISNPNSTCEGIIP